MRRERPDAARLRRLIADGLTPAQIAARLGVSRDLVYLWLKELSLQPARPRVKPLGAWGDGARTAEPLPERLRPQSKRMGG